MCEEDSELSRYPTLRLRYGEEMSIREIAEKLGVCERTVNRRIAREIAMYLEDHPYVSEWFRMCRILALPSGAYSMG